MYRLLIEVDLNARKHKPDVDFGVNDLMGWANAMFARVFPNKVVMAKPGGVVGPDGKPTPDVTITMERFRVGLAVAAEEVNEATEPSRASVSSEPGDTGPEKPAV